MVVFNDAKVSGSDMHLMRALQVGHDGKRSVISLPGGINVCWTSLQGPAQTCFRPASVLPWKLQHYALLQENVFSGCEGNKKKKEKSRLTVGRDQNTKDHSCQSATKRETIGGSFSPTATDPAGDSRVEIQKSNTGAEK